MLGFGPLGRLALGQAPSLHGVAAGALLPLAMTLDAGAAAGNVLVPPIVIIGPPYRWARGQDAVARGALILLDVSLLPGQASGVATINARAPGAVLRREISLVAGTAAGDTISYDNDFLLLEAA